MRKNDILFSVIGAGLLAFAVILVVNTIALIGRAQRTDGTVVRVVKTEDVEGGITFRPIVSFMNASGDHFEFTGSTGSSPSLYTPGDRVTVLHEPGHEADALIQNVFELWALPAISVVLGALFVGIGLEPWWRRQRLRWLVTSVPKKDGEPGRWYRLVFRSGEVEHVEQVLAALRNVRIACLVEKLDAAGVSHELAPGEDLTTGGPWNVLVAEDSLQVARRTLCNLPSWTTSDRAGHEERSFESTPLSQVILWGLLFVSAIAVLAIAIGVDRGTITVYWPNSWFLGWTLGGMTLATVVLVYVIDRKGRRWPVHVQRRFLEARRVPERDLDEAGRSAGFD